MKELDYQKLLIDVIKKHGGFSFKSSNRFLVGVADVFLTIEHLERPLENVTGFLECKLDPIPVRKYIVNLDTTVKQRQFLNNVIKGGARGAVVSFIRDAKQLGIAIVPPDQLEVPKALFKYDSHQKREALIWRVLEGWLNGGN